MNELEKLEALYYNSNPGEFREMYNLDGTPAGCGQQHWSASGYLSMVFHDLFGMNFEEDGLRLDPLMPPVFGGGISLTNIAYRDMTLDITIEDSGFAVKEFFLDETKGSDPFVPGDLTGTHSVRIVMSHDPVNATFHAVRPFETVTCTVRKTYRCRTGAVVEIKAGRPGVVTLFSAAGAVLGRATIPDPEKSVILSPGTMSKVVFVSFTGTDATRSYIKLVDIN
jgi:hypothetical protein